MSIKKLDDGRYEVDIRPRGREGRRIRRKFDRKAEALAFERYTLANAQTKEWAGKQRIVERFQNCWTYGGSITDRIMSMERRSLTICLKPLVIWETCQLQG